MEKLQPNFLVIDSIQTIMTPDIPGTQGSVSQVREVTGELMQIAKTNNIATFIVGHVTKEGTLAGPRMLEHMLIRFCILKENVITRFEFYVRSKIVSARQMKLEFLRCKDMD